MADKIDPTWSDVGEATSLELYKPTEYKKYSVASRNACAAGNLHIALRFLFLCC